MALKGENNRNLENDLAGAGSTINTEDTITVDLSGDGSALTPLTADVNVSANEGNAILEFDDGLYVPKVLQNGLVYGGIVTWAEDYTYEATEAGYYINGVFYIAPARTIANGNPIVLNAPDATFNRIDVFYVGTDSTIEVLEGTPSSTPNKPDVQDDEIELSFALVETGTTQPTLEQEQIYLENAGEPNEWTAVSNSGNILVNSLLAPPQGTVNIDANASVSGNAVTITNDAPIAISIDHTVLTFKISPEATAGNNKQKRLEISFRLGGTVVGNVIKLNTGSYGYDIAATGIIHTISIALADFGLTDASTIDNLFIQNTSVGGATYGFHIDDIELQGVPVTPPTPELTLTTIGTTGPSTYDNVTNTLNVPIYTASVPQGLQDVITVDPVLTVDNTINNTGNNLIFTLGTGSSFSMNGTNIGGVIDDGSGTLGSLSINNATTKIQSTDGTTNSLVSVNASSTVELVSNDGVDNTEIILNPTNIKLDSPTLSIPNLTGGSTAGYVLTDLIGDGTATWEPASGGGGDLTTASNGLTEVSDDIRLGGSLTQDTTIDTNTWELYVTGDRPNTVGVLNVTNTNSTDNSSAISIKADNIEGWAIYATSTNGRGLYATSTNGYGILGESTNLIGILGGSNTGTGIQAQSDTGEAALVAIGTATVGARIQTQLPGNNTVATVLQIARDEGTGGGGDNGIGGSIDFLNETTTLPYILSGRIINKWTDATHASRTSESEIWLTNNTTSERKLHIAGTGAVTLDDYGGGTITGTPTYGAAFDSTGKIIEVALGGGGSLSANNGLTENVTDNVQLGGSLVQNTTVTGAGFAMNFTNNTGTGTLTVTNSSNGYALFATAQNSVAVWAEATTGTAFFANVGNNAEVFDGVASHTSQNDVKQIMLLNRNSSGGVGQDGIGLKLVFGAETSVTTSVTTNELISKWSTATHASRTSEFIITGVDNATAAADKLTLSGTGALKLNEYGGGSFTGTATYSLQVDSSGNVIEGALGGGSLSADNGLTENVANNVQLGGTLLQDTTISTGAFYTHFTGANQYDAVLKTTNSFTGNAFTAISSNVGGVGAYIYASAGGTGLISSSSGGTSFSIIAENNALPASILKYTSSFSGVSTLMEVKRLTNSGSTVLDGFGSSIDFYGHVTGFSAPLSNQITSKWTTVSVSARTSEFSIQGVDTAVTYTVLQISGTGLFTLTRGLIDYANDAAAAAGGIPVNGLYRNGSVVQIRVS